MDVLLEGRGEGYLETFCRRISAKKMSGKLSAE